MITTICNNISETIGNTPIVKINHPLIPDGKKLFVKLEQFNPNLSIKDRTALGLIHEAFKSGRLKKGGTVIESTSGNLGKSLAMLGASMGFNVVIVVDPKVSSSALNWFKAFGATVILVTEKDSNGGYQSTRIEKVKEYLLKKPDTYWPNQYENSDNPTYHYNTTSKEVASMNVDLISGAISTGGHMSGIANGVKQLNDTILTVACDVVGSAILNKKFKPYLVNGAGLSWRSSNLDETNIDFTENISDEEAFTICHEMAKSNGILLGGSSGLSIMGALIGLQLDYVNSAMAICPDTGVNYLDQFYDENWLEENNVNILSSEILHDRISTYAYHWSNKE
ncbi:pyridoxal-phosphate dependent enzyme [Vibrio sp. S9_S30]|uniref:pyridoxal-phosphate dependent enzyme n=1 Tax=Vibrio sp. S9_S30 TaxID=2720226 RepID=UPI0016813028|nr:pyridoxal-phosphate dependent enzyme [Vibrio sp. S9_S30]MBD1559758.1 pyridoxal-phosphate dependent enzyme [Vibrio sp. S9_S30]